MTIFTGIILYIMIYWLMLFAVLPFGNRPVEEVEMGNATSAPANPRMKVKFLVTAVVAAIIWTAVFLMIRFDVIDFYSIAEQMQKEDLAK